MWATAASLFFFVKYDEKEKQLEVFVDTTAPRYITSSCLVDYDTLAGADKFGNVFLARIGAGVDEDITTDITGGKAQLTGQYGKLLQGSSHKLKDVVRTHVGEMVTKIQKGSLVPGGTEVLVYGSIMGGIGIFEPFTSREDIEFFSHLEMHMRQEHAPLCGRDHLAKSYYTPVKDCIDGDLCEQFATLDYKKQVSIAEELVCTPAEVLKKLEEMRNRVL